MFITLILYRHNRLSIRLSKCTNKGFMRYKSEIRTCPQEYWEIVLYDVEK